jgi:hypothetical protein
MANATIVTYECELCGSEVVVTSTGESRLSPIYCCGMEVTQISSMKKGAKKAQKKTVKKGTKKVLKKKTAKKRKPAAKKKSSKK